MFRRTIAVLALMLTGCASRSASTISVDTVAAPPLASAPSTGVTPSLPLMPSPLIPGILTSWQTPNGPLNVAHLAGVTDDFHCVVYVWSLEHDWKTIDVTQITGQKVVGPLTSWQTPDGPYNVEHLAATGHDSSPYVFWRSKGHDWRFVNAAAPAGPAKQPVSLSGQ